MIQIYSDNKYRKYLLSKIDKLYKKANLQLKCVPNGIIANQPGIGFGVFDRDYKFVKSSIQNHKGQKGQIIPKFNHDDIKYIDADVVFLCHTGRNHFGHFLLEQINRAWVLCNKNFKGIKIVIIDEKKVRKIPRFVYKLLGLLGVEKQDIILLQKTTQFKNVYIPEPGFDMDSYYADKFVEMYNKMAKKVPDNKIYDKIYLSRYAMPKDRRTFGENKIQKIFERNGYHIIYPETLSLNKQIALVKNCKILAGCAGTALHLALFMKKGGKVIQIKRNSIISDNAPVQYLINMAKGLDSIFVYASVETRKTEHWSVVPQIIGVTEYMQQFFDENGFKYNSRDLTVNKSERAIYEKMLKKFPKKNPIVAWIKRKFIHFSSCLIPGRVMRKKYRHFLRKYLS